MLCHYTLTTGDLRRSPRSEASDDVIALLAPLLRTGWHDVPGQPGYRLRVTVERTVLLATVHAGEVPLSTFGVAVDRAGLDVLSELMHVQPSADVWVPACLARVEVSAALAPAAMAWVSDLERCVAWAWVER